MKFAANFREQQNTEWSRMFLQYDQLSSIIHEYAEKRTSKRQVVMITMTSYGAIVHMPSRFQSQFEKMKLRPLEDQIERLQALASSWNEEYENREKMLNESWDALNLDPDREERKKARILRHMTMRNLFSSDELLAPMEESDEEEQLKILSQTVARASLCSIEFFKSLNKELKKVNRFYMKEEFEFLKRHLALLRQVNFYVNGSFNTWKKFRFLSKLRKALKEHYRTLELLERYKKLNHSAFRRIVKKFEKHTKNQVRKNYYRSLDNQYFRESHILHMMKRQSETIAEKVLYQKKGAKNAMHQLKVPETELHQVHLSEAFWTGGWFGIDFLLTIVLILFYFLFYRDIEHEVSYAASTAYASRILLFPIVMVMFVGLNLKIWIDNQINYQFIFELNPRDTISETHFLRMGFQLYFLWCSFTLAGMYMVYQDFHNQTFKGLGWLTVVILYVLIVVLWFLPLNIWHRSSRYWLIKHLIRIALAPLKKVLFADFWIADQLTTLGHFLFDLQLLWCVYTWDPPFCTSNASLGIPIMNLWPDYARLMQCLRRFVTSRKPVHLLNAGKYSMSMLSIFTLMFDARIFPTDSSKLSGWRVAWMIIHTLSSVYKLMWDYYFDWGLFRLRHPNAPVETKPKYPLLRHDLFFHPGIYYLAILNNFVLRFFWVPIIMLKIYFPTYMQTSWVVTIVGVCEVFRRFVWNIFRLENEQISNCGDFRVTKEIPLLSDNYKDQSYDKKESPFVKLIDKIFGVQSKLAIEYVGVRLKGRKSNLNMSEYSDNDSKLPSDYGRDEEQSDVENYKDFEQTYSRHDSSSNDSDVPSEQDLESIHSPWEMITKIGLEHLRDPEVFQNVFSIPPSPVKALDEKENSTYIDIDEIDDIDSKATHSPRSRHSSSGDDSKKSFDV